MIDWQRKLYTVLHDPIPTGQVLSIDPSGAVEWVSPKRISVRGSYESNILVRSQGGNGRGQATELYIDGIAIPNDHETSNVIPLIRIIEATPAEVPQWAYDKGLIFHR